MSAQFSMLSLTGAWHVDFYVQLFIPPPAKSHLLNCFFALGGHREETQMGEGRNRSVRICGFGSLLKGRQSIAGPHVQCLDQGHLGSALRVLGH